MPNSFTPFLVDSIWMSIREPIHWADWEQLNHREVIVTGVLHAVGGSGYGHIGDWEAAIAVTGVHLADAP